MKIAKKGVGHPSSTYAEALEVALCFGWIDGQKRASTKLLAAAVHPAPGAQQAGRRSTGTRREALIAAGEMAPAGLAEVERAKADGRWEAAYERQTGRRCPRTSQRRWRPNPRRRRSSPRSTAPTATRSSTGSGGQEARDTGAADREVRRDAGARREAPSLVAPAPSIRPQRRQGRLVSPGGTQVVPRRDGRVAGPLEEHLARGSAGAVGAEGPDVARRVLGRELARPVVLVGEPAHDLRAGVDGAVVQGVGIVDDHVDRRSAPPGRWRPRGAPRRASPSRRRGAARHGR